MRCACSSGATSLTKSRLSNSATGARPTAARPVRTGSACSCTPTRLARSSGSWAAEAGTSARCTRLRTGLASRLRALHGALDVDFHHRDGLGQLVPGAELDELRAGLGGGDVSRGHVEGVARLVCLRVVGVADRDLACEQVTPVRALAAIAGEPPQQRGE